MKREAASTADDEDPRARLTPVYTVIEEPRVKAMIASFSRPVVLDAVKTSLDRFREEMGPDESPPGIDEIVARVEAVLLEDERDRLRPVVNATGIILHTGLGRAVLPRRAVEALADQGRCCNMQVDLPTGQRGRRNWRTEQLLMRLTGAEAAIVVNNNAAATLLVLTALCEGKDCIVSQGQLIEIGGSFRLPDCIEQSGANIVKVGTTNRTHLRDYEAELTEDTGAILRANPSNYRVVGFSKEVSVAELVTLKQKHPVLVIDDLGCGALVDTEQYGLPKEPTVQESIAAGVDVACFSGDKLIGGPQSGIIVGKKDIVARIRKHPLTRMMRVCKLTDVALEQSLRLFLDPERLLDDNPTLGMLAAPASRLEPKAEALEALIDAEDLPLEVEVRKEASAVGGGSMPATPLDTYVLALSSPTLSPDRLSQLLRLNEPPIIARISEGAVLLDVRTLLEGDAEVIHEALCRIGREVNA